MKELLVLIVAVCFSSTIIAQNTLSKAEDSDPQATALLKKVKQKYESFASLEMDFSISIKLAEQPEEIQQGKLAQQGESYRLDIQGQTIFFDGQTVWLYLKSLNEVQIMDANFEEEGVLSPKDLLQIYESDDYVYALTNRLKRGNRLLQQIEFKPLNKDFDYTKLRVSIDQNTNEIAMIEAFARDASKYTLKVNQLTPNKSFDANYFKFDAADYPDVYVEDLRE